MNYKQLQQEVKNLRQQLGIKTPINVSQIKLQQTYQEMLQIINQKNQIISHQQMEQELFLLSGTLFRHICDICNLESVQDFICQELYCECGNQMQYVHEEQHQQAVNIYNQFAQQGNQSEVSGRASKWSKVNQNKNLPNSQDMVIGSHIMKRINKMLDNGQIKKALKLLQNHLQSIASKQFNYKINYTTNEGQKLSTKFQNIHDSFVEMVKQILEYEERYGVENTQNIIGNKITIQRIKKTGNIQQQVRGGMKIINMINKYVLISPQSYSNCLYHCIAYYKLMLKGKDFNDNDKIIEMAKQIKKSSSNTKDFCDLSDVQEMSDKYGCNFKLYNNIFQKLNGSGIIKPQSKDKRNNCLFEKTIKIQFRNGHAILMLRKQDVDQQLIKQTKQKEECVEQCRPIIPKSYIKKQKKNRIIMTYDIECLVKDKQTGRQIPFAIGLCEKYNPKTHQYSYKRFYGFECIQQFSDYLSQMQIENTEVFLYAHNGAKYDLTIVNNILFNSGLFEISDKGFLELNGGIINQTIKNKNNLIFHFRDSCRIFAGSLDGLCRDLKPKHMKQSEHKFNFDDLNEENVMGIHRQEIEEYLMHDCLSLAEIMISFRQKLLIDKSIGIDVLDCYTSATLSKKIYFKNYYKRYTKKWLGGKPIDRYIYELSREIDLDIRQGYFGGRCDIYKYGTFKKVYYYDFTSLYPYIGSKFVMPIDLPQKIDGKDIDIKKFFGFIRCKVTTNDKLPLHGFKYNSKLIFADHKNTEMMLFSEEIKLGLELGYKYDFIYGYQFDKAMLLKDVMVDGFQRKADAKKNNESIMEKTWKIVINSCYGFFGLRWMDKRGIKMMNKQQLDSCIDQQKVYNYNQIGEDKFLVDQETDLFDIQGKNIAIASAVTSYARMVLYQLMKDIQDKGFDIVYSDTDSIITTCNIKQHKDLMKKYQWDGNGTELGSLKNECDDKLKDLMKKQLEIDGGELYFDECQILAPKVYSLRKTLYNGQVIEIAKMKGIQKSSFDEQTRLLNGDNITRQVNMFIGGRQSYMKENNLGIDVIKKNKKISQIDSLGLLKYKKGLIINQDVIPYVFVEGKMI